MVKKLATYFVMSSNRGSLQGIYLNCLHFGLPSLVKVLEGCCKREKQLYVTLKFGISHGKLLLS